MTISHTAVHLALKNRLLTVSGLPVRAAENKAYTPTPGTAYLTESLVPATQELVGLTPDGPVKYTGLYVVTLYCLPDTGLAVSTSADAILAKFAPGSTLTTTDNTTVRIRGDIAPTRGQVRDIDGWAVCTISIPYQILT